MNIPKLRLAYTEEEISFIKDGEVIVEGKEVRACVVKDPNSSKGFKATTFPTDVIAKFE